MALRAVQGFRDHAMSIRLFKIFKLGGTPNTQALTLNHTPETLNPSDRIGSEAQDGGGRCLDSKPEP